MDILSATDLFKLKKQTLVAEYDFDTLVNLYQPIVGYDAIGVYMTLWSLTNHSAKGQIFSHKEFLATMMMETGVFVRARKKLEAVSLLRTEIIRAVDKHSDLYIYSLRAPETPKNFFDNIFLHGLLTKTLGEKIATKQKSLYMVDIKDTEGDDITDNIHNVFTVQDQNIFLKILNSREEVVGRLRAKVNLKFNHDLFITALISSSQIRKESLTQDHLNEIERIASLYGINEEDMALIVIDNFNYGADSDHRINFDSIIDECMMQEKVTYKPKNDTKRAVINSESEIGSKINLFETVSPRQFLQYKQNNTAPVKSDLKIIETLSKDLNLKPAVINALLDYTLTMAGNSLPRAYITKIGAVLARENITTAYDAMNILRERSKNIRYRPKKDDAKIMVDPESQIVLSPEDELKQWNKILEELGNKNGKNKN